MCYKCFLLGAHLRANCLDLPLIARCDYFLCGTVEENASIIDKGAHEHLHSILNLFEQKGAKFVPIKVEGDGNCLVHSISRSIGAHEHLYSVLRASLTAELIDNETFYRNVTGGFYHHDGEGNYSEQIEWARPTSRAGQWMSPLHIFGLANVLKRPIILLDGRINPVPGSNGRGIYLPSRFRPEQCVSEEGSGELPSPIVISWSSAALNHYVCLTHLMGEVNQEQPIGAKHRGSLPAGCVRACRSIRSVVPVERRLMALEGLRNVLRQCSQSSPPKLQLDQNRRLVAAWSQRSNGTAIDGVRDFLREVGFIQSFDTEEPEKRTKPWTNGMASGTANACISVFRAAGDFNVKQMGMKLIDLAPVVQLLNKCDGKTSDSEIITNHQLGLLQFIRCVHSCTIHLELKEEDGNTSTLNFPAVKKTHTAVLESLRYILRSKLLAEAIATLYQTNSLQTKSSISEGEKKETDGDEEQHCWNEVPIRMCLAMLKLFNRDKKGRKSVSLGGILKTFQVIGNLLALNETLIQDSTLYYMLDVLKQIQRFFTKLPEDDGGNNTNLPLCNFNHQKEDTRLKYERIATAFSVIIFNCSVVLFQKRRGSSSIINATMESAQARIKEQQSSLELRTKALIVQLQEQEITAEEYATEFQALHSLKVEDNNRVVRSTHSHLYQVDKRAHEVCRQMMQVSAIYLDKTIDVVEDKIYVDADNDVLRALYTVLYGDSRRAGFLVHACKTTQLIQSLRRRQKSSTAQRVLSACCVQTKTKVNFETENNTCTSKSSAAPTTGSCAASPRGKKRILHMPVVDALIVKVFCELIDNEIKVASTAARDCQNQACGKRITATLDMINSGSKLTCPECRQEQDITRDELEIYQTTQATEMRTATRCAISFADDRKLFTNVMFADSLLLSEEEKQNSQETATTTTTTTTERRPSLRKKSKELMDEIWDRARQYANDGEWSFATGQGPDYLTRGTMEDTERHFRVLTGGANILTVVKKDTGMKYEMNCYDCHTISKSDCDINTYLAADQIPACAACKSTNLEQLPPRCTYQDTVMGIVQGTLDDVQWECRKCKTKNDAIHAWCQSCQQSRPLATIQTPQNDVCNMSTDSTSEGKIPKAPSTKEEGTSNMKMNQ